MKLELIVDGRPSRLDLQSGAPQCRFQIDGGPPRTAEVETPEPGVYSVLMDGAVYDARVEETDGALAVVIGGFRFEVKARDPRRWTRGAAAGTGHGLATIKAPMPGKIVRLLVAAGDTVEAGQGLVVVEAMKMQNEMKAARAGRVAAVLAQQGATVAAGEALLTIE